MNKFIVLFLLVFSYLTHAYEYAYTINDTTIVYADMALKMPIGYIKEGRKLVVGNGVNEKNTITPIILDGKIVFVKSADITFENGGIALSSAPIVKEHRVVDIDDNYLDKLVKNTYFIADFSNLDAGTNVDTLTDALGGAEETSFIKFNIGLENRIMETRSAFGIYFSYLRASNDVLTLKTALLGGEYQYRLLKVFSAASIEVYGGLFFGTDIDLKTTRTTTVGAVTTTSTEELFGSLWGYKYGGRMRLFPYSKFSFYASMGITQIKPFNMDKGNTVSSGTYELEDFGGLDIAVGLSVKL